MILKRDDDIKVLDEEHDKIGIEWCLKNGYKEVIKDGI